MDEIDWIKNTKKAIIFIMKIVSIFIGILVLAGVVCVIREGINKTTIMPIIIFVCIGIGIIFFEILMYGIIYIIYKIMYGGQKKIGFKKEYLREISKECTPAIASLIYDLKVDVYKDYTATVLHLYSKGYINIFENNEICKIEINKNKDISALQGHERYVIDCLSNREKFDENLFKEILLDNARSKNLLTKEKESKFFRVLILIIISLAIVVGSYFINKKAFVATSTVFIGIAFGILFIKFSVKNGMMQATVVDTLYKRTATGEKKARELQALKRFISEYTLIKEKNIEHVQILEEYIPYAIALGEAKNIEEYIKSNTAYRNLIYNRKEK